MDDGIESMMGNNVRLICLHPPKQSNPRRTPQLVALLMDPPRTRQLPLLKFHHSNHISDMCVDSIVVHESVGLDELVSDEFVGSVLFEGELAECGGGVGV